MVKVVKDSRGFAKKIEVVVVQSGIRPQVEHVLTESGIERMSHGALTQNFERDSARPSIELKPLLFDFRNEGILFAAEGMCEWQSRCEASAEVQIASAVGITVCDIDSPQAVPNYEHDRVAEIRKPIRVPRLKRFVARDKDYRNIKI